MYHRRDKIIIKYKLNNIAPSQIIKDIGEELDKEDNNENSVTSPTLKPTKSTTLVKYPSESLCEQLSRVIHSDPYPYKYDYEMSIDEEPKVLNKIYKQISLVFLFFQPPVVIRENPFIESIKRDGETFTVTSPETIFIRNREKQLANTPSRNRSLVTSLSTSDIDGSSYFSLNHKINGVPIVRHNDSLLNTSHNKSISDSFNQSRPMANSLDGAHITVNPSSTQTNSHDQFNNTSTKCKSHSINAAAVVPEVCSSVNN